MGQAFFQRRSKLLKEEGSGGIREKGENRLSTDDLTIKANTSSEQCSVYYSEWVKHLSREDINCRRKGIRGIREKRGNTLSADDLTIIANDSSDC